MPYRARSGAAAADSASSASPRPLSLPVLPAWVKHLDELFVDSSPGGMKLGDNEDYMEASPSATPDEPLWPVYSETENPETAEPEETGNPG